MWTCNQLSTYLDQIVLSVPVNREILEAVDKLGDAAIDIHHWCCLGLERRLAIS